jgi:hypothetical protein
VFTDCVDGAGVNGLKEKLPDEDPVLLESLAVVEAPPPQNEFEVELPGVVVVVVVVAVVVSLLLLAFGFLKGFLNCSSASAC